VGKNCKWNDSILKESSERELREAALVFHNVPQVRLHQLCDDHEVSWLSTRAKARQDVWMMYFATQ
jgi:hypothetical protein